MKKMPNTLQNMIESVTLLTQLLGADGACALMCAAATCVFAERGDEVEPGKRVDVDGAYLLFRRIAESAVHGTPKPTGEDLGRVLIDVV